MKDPCETCIIRTCCTRICDKFRKYYKKAHPCNDCALKTQCELSLGEKLGCKEFCEFEHNHNPVFFEWPDNSPE